MTSQFTIAGAVPTLIAMALVLANLVVWKAILGG